MNEKLFTRPVRKHTQTKSNCRSFTLSVRLRFSLYTIVLCFHELKVSVIGMPLKHIRPVYKGLKDLDILCMCQRVQHRLSQTNERTRKCQIRPPKNISQKPDLKL